MQKALMIILIQSNSNLNYLYEKVRIKFQNLGHVWKI